MSGNRTLEGDNALRAEKMLQHSAQILTRAKVPFCIDGGTLLGIVREGRLLPWDNDMDLYVSSDNTAALLRSVWKFRLAGYKVKKRYASKDMGPIKKGQLRLIKIKKRKGFFNKESVLLDIFVKYRHEEKDYWVVGIENPVLKSVDSIFYSAFGCKTFKGYDYPIPMHVEDYLTARYGDWRVPVKQWNFLTDDKAIISAHRSGDAPINKG